MEKRVVYIDRMLDKVVNEQIHHRRREEANRRSMSPASRMRPTPPCARIVPPVPPSAAN